MLRQRCGAEREHREIARAVDDDVVDRCRQRPDAVGESPFRLPYVAERGSNACQRGRAGDEMQIRYAADGTDAVSRTALVEQQLEYRRLRLTGPDTDRD